MNNLSATHSRVSRLLWALDVASVYSSFPLFDYLVFYFFPFISFFFLRLLHNNNDRAAAPRGFFSFFFCLELDGRRRAPKTCFISFRVKRKKKKNKRRTTLLDISPKNPVIIQQLPISLASWKEWNREREKNRDSMVWRHLITWSAHVLILQPWPRVGWAVTLLSSSAWRTLRFWYNSTSATNFT